MYDGSSLPLVSTCLHAPYVRRVGSEVLLLGASAVVLDRCAPLDDASGRGGPALGRLPEGIPDQRARCGRGIPTGGVAFLRAVLIKPSSKSRDGPHGGS